MSIFRGFGAILYKEFITVFRDRITLFFMFFPPLLQIIAFGFALDTDVKNMAMVVLDEDRTVASRQLVSTFQNTGTFRVLAHVNSVAELEGFIRRGQAYIGVQIPPDFSRQLRAGERATVQALIDGSNSTTALQALNSAVAVAFRQSVALLLQESGRSELPVEVRPQMLYNPAMRSPNFFVPGVIGAALQIASVFAAAMSIVRERERGTLENLFVSPLSGWGLMLGKLMPYLGIAMAMGGVLVLILRLVFDVPIRGDLATLFLAIFLYVFALLSLGLLISTKAQSQNEAIQMAMVVLLPSIFFSGFIFPRETLPWVFQALSALLPLTYFVDLMRGIVLRGATFADMAGHLAALAVMGLLLFSLCALRFKRKLS